MNRRQFLKGSVAAAIGVVVPWPFKAVIHPHPSPLPFGRGNETYPPGLAIPMGVPFAVGADAAAVVYRVYAPVVAVGGCEPPADP